MEFKAQPRTIQDALGLKRKYIIPRFQREYSWGSDELNTLWDDMIDNLNYENGQLVAVEYFIGSLVLIGDDDDSINVDRQVVDGQQRLMTFTIAFSALSQKFKSLKEDKLAELMHRYIIGEDENGTPGWSLRPLSHFFNIEFNKQILTLQERQLPPKKNEF